MLFELLRCETEDDVVDEDPADDGMMVDTLDDFSGEQREEELLWRLFKWLL